MEPTEKQIESYKNIEAFLDMADKLLDSIEDPRCTYPAQLSVITEPLIHTIEESVEVLGAVFEEFVLSGQSPTQEQSDAVNTALWKINEALWVVKEGGDKINNLHNKNN